MAGAGDFKGLVAVCLAVVCYGSYFVPVKKYEVHDGLVYQWYQCNGIMFAGFLCALARNTWGAQGEESDGFYVAPEGLLSGLIFQLANMTATVSVKAFGLGNYYTVHQVTNLGVTFVVGIFGPGLGLPAKPPSDVVLASFGFLLVFLGMGPVMFMEKEVPRAAETLSAGVSAAGEAASQAPAADGAAPGPPLPEEAQQPAENVDADRLSSLFSFVPPRRMATDAARGLPVRRPAPIEVSDYRMFNSNTWDGTIGRPHLSSDATAHTEPQSPLSFFGDAGLCVKEVPASPAPWEEAAAGADALGAHLLQGRAAHDDGDGADCRRRWPWLRGLLLSLTAGALYAGMYVPLLPWKQRMQEQGQQVHGFDTFFSMCVGLYIASTLWLLVASLWKKYRGQRMEKSVLRPALASGLIYAVALLSFLYALMLLPYAVGYAIGVGGGLAVSLLWGTLVFGEAATPHNRRCVVASFVGVFFGIVLLGLSA